MLVTIILGVLATALWFSWRQRRTLSSEDKVTASPAKPSDSSPAAADTDEKPTPKPLRGTWLVKVWQAMKLWVELLLQKALNPSDLVPLGVGYILPDAETQHLRIPGSSGTGKSTAIKKALAVIAQRPHQRAIIVDLDGGYVSRFFNPERGDRILNPFDARTSGWDLSAEINEEYDSEQIAAALVPERTGDAAEWAEYGQQIIGSTIAALKRRGELTPKRLWEVVNIEPRETWKALIAGTQGSRFFQDGNERMLGSIMSVTTPGIAGLRYLRGKGDFSLSQYVRSDDRGWLFLTFKAKQRDALKNIIASWMRILIFSLMDRPEGDSGTWFVIDELDALGRIGGLTDALSRVRKFGGRCILAFQAIGQLRHLYGYDQTGALLENCSNTLIFKCSSTGRDAGTSDFAAALLGQREVLRSTKQTTKSSGSNMAWGSLARLAPTGSKNSSSSTTLNRVIEPVLLPSQLEGLPNLTGYCHSHGTDFWAKCVLEPDQGETVAEAFVPRQAEHVASAEAPESLVTSDETEPA